MYNKFYFDFKRHMFERYQSQHVEILQMNILLEVDTNSLVGIGDKLRRTSYLYFARYS